ncbi:hypothetical protein COLO4_34020 [Corchorus olitorius]|uniref:F-box domain-containing protein n=1 Tax=Corchorus olitorius TaxID=93759 RepID=A0A1R3GP56_9ROSI|nr:hypothetical protein COLO4_34020 [Corchorus olitorius]
MTEEQLLFDDANVPDWLLIEILQRLPIKHIFMFKCVSKRWLTLISDPLFARSYANRINHGTFQDSQDSQPWNLLFRYLFEVRILPSSMIDDRVALNQFQDFTLPGFSLNFLPSEQDCPIKILASSNGLLLCSESFYWQKNYYICNPFTRQWISLPKPLKSLQSVAIGFISKDNGGYNLVRIPVADSSSDNFLQLETFSSQTGQWNCSMIHSPVPGYSIKTDSPVLHYNGNVHWLEFRHGKIITYNPDKDSGQLLRLMNLPDGKESEHLSLLGLSCGRFRYFEVTDTCQGPRNLCIWVLSDYDAQEWCLEYRIRFSDSWSNQDELNRFIPKDNFYIFPLALHPFDLDLVYLGYGGCLVGYNLRTRKLEVVRRNVYSHQLLAFVFSPWPTMIPQPSW